MAQPDTQQITQLLLAWNQGESAALEKLIPVVHQQLRRMARRLMMQERLDHTLQATALVNEAYLQLIDCSKITWQNRAQFFAISSQLMRRILVDFARSRHYQKRGGGAQKVSLDSSLEIASAAHPDLVALDDALKALASLDPRKVQVVECRFFGGLSVEETAEVLKVSTDTVVRDWKMAKVWLLKEMIGSDQRQREMGSVIH